ncbi:MAG: VWA domain-containing protein [Terrimicrobiaceae bacterium]
METTSLTFQSPMWFAALALVPIFGGLLIWAQFRSERLISRVVAPRLREQLAGAVSKSLRIFRAILILAAFSAIVVALARPQYGFIEREIIQQGRDIILAIDTSRSMLATDVTPNRLARAKLFAKDLLRLAEGDRVGVIAFAGGAFLQAPLTLDRSASLAAIDELDTDIIPKGGTNIAEAIRLAMKAFGKGEGQTRALIVLTDGEELDADGIAAARKAQEEGVRIFTVGVGSAEGSLIPIRDDSGRQDFVRDQAGKPVQSRLDASRLSEIATAGGGFYEPLEADTASVVFNKGILPMETTERGSMASRQPLEKYQWPLGVGMALLVVWLLVGERRRQARPTALAAAIAVLAGIPCSWAQTGTEAYQAGNYEEALGDFQSRLEKSPDSAKLQFNAGAAAYKLNKHGEAVDFFAKALATGSPEPEFLNSATYNLANALVRRGEGAEKSEEKKADWKNAISHYETVLKSDPKNKLAEENRDIVKKLLEDLEKQEEEQKKDQQDQKDEQKKDDQQKDDQKQDQKDNQQKDDQQKDQQGDQQNQDQKNQDQKQESGKDEEKKDQGEKSGEQEQQGEQDPKEPGDQKQEPQSQGNEGQDSKQEPGAAPSPTPGEKKEGEIKSLGEEEQAAQEMAAAEEAAEKDGQMSEAQARALLNSLRRDEDRVPLMRPAMQEETLKDW